MTVADPNPEKFAIYFTGDDGIIFQDGQDFAGVIYAPNGFITFASGYFYGAFVANEVMIGNDVTIEYDPNLQAFAAPPPAPSATPTANNPTPTNVPPTSTPPSIPPTATPTVAIGTDTVTISKLEYKDQKSEVIVHARSDAQPGASLTVTIDGLVQNAPMTWTATS